MAKLLEQFNALPPWQRYLLLLALPLILSGYLWFLLLAPLREEVASLENKKNAESQTIQRLKADINPKVIERLKQEEERLKAELEVKQRELDSLVGAIPTQKDMGMVVNTLSNMARKSGVTILNIQFKPPQSTMYVLEEAGGKKVVKESQPQQQQTQQQKQKQQQAPQGVKYYKLETNITLTGTYRSINSFIEGLRKGGFVSYPVDLSITKGEGRLLRAGLTLFIIMREEGVQ